MSLIAGIGIFLVVCAVLLAVGLDTAPEGEEIPGVGFVKTGKK